jgi:hypothetical protein
MQQDEDARITDKVLNAEESQEKQPFSTKYGEEHNAYIFLFSNVYRFQIICK